jgi:hypothetical protein
LEVLVLPSSKDPSISELTHLRQLTLLASCATWYCLWNLPCGSYIGIAVHTIRISAAWLTVRLVLTRVALILLARLACLAVASLALARLISALVVVLRTVRHG